VAGAGVSAAGWKDERAAQHHQAGARQAGGRAAETMGWETGRDACHVTFLPTRGAYQAAYSILLRQACLPGRTPCLRAHLRRIHDGQRGAPTAAASSAYAVQAVAGVWRK